MLSYRPIQSNPPKRSSQHGLSIVELLVGVAIGLFVAGGAISLTVSNLNRNRQLLVETRVIQDLRAASDVIARDIRRASYWNAASSGLWSASAGGTPAASNLYAPIDTSSSSQIIYKYDRPGVVPTNSATNLGFRRETTTSGIKFLQLQNASSGWLDLTDPNSVHISAFTITPVSPAIVVYLDSYCGCLTTGKCLLSVLQARPSGDRAQVVIRKFTILLRGQAVVSGAPDPSVTRELQQTVRVRNDEIKNPNSCPAA